MIVCLLVFLVPSDFFLGDVAACVSWHHESRRNKRSDFADSVTAPWVIFQIYMDHVMNQIYWDRCWCGDPIRPTLNLTSGLNAERNRRLETKRDKRKRTSIASYLFDHTRERRFKKWSRWMCVWDKSRERGKEKVTEKKKKTDGGRERWEQWRVICGSHGPENELLVLTWLNVCMRAQLCVCVIRVPQSAETKGVSPWHLLSPRNMTHHQGGRQNERRGVEPTFHLFLPPL